jgi:hypothetical protein
VSAHSECFIRQKSQPLADLMDKAADLERQLYEERGAFRQRAELQCLPGSAMEEATARPGQRHYRAEVPPAISENGFWVSGPAPGTDEARAWRQLAQAGARLDRWAVLTGLAGRTEDRYGYHAACTLRTVAAGERALHGRREAGAR